MERRNPQASNLVAKLSKLWTGRIRRAADWQAGVE
jgi:hypothetical protein